jgi:hypothetical protein
MADAPRVGQIVNHHFLWIDEQAAGQIEGRKARPCLIIAVEPSAAHAAPSYRTSGHKSVAARRSRRGCNS